MTAGQQASAGTMGESRTDYTIGLGGASTFGFILGSFGSCTPSNGFRSSSIREASSTLTSDFTLVLTGALAQSYFRRLIVQTSTGVLREYLSSVVTGFFVGTHSTWTWGTATNKVWTAATPSPRALYLLYN